MTATFSEPVTGVTSSDFAVVNGSKTSFTAVSSTVYTVIVTPTLDWVVTVDMPVAAATDTATNTSTAATQLTRNYDGTAPIISQTTAVVTPKNDSTPSYTFTSDEVGTISYSGGCVSPTTAAVVWANTISFNTLVDGTYAACTITVTDIATNASNVLAVSSFTIDTVIPTVALTTPASASTNAPFTVTATFSEAVTGIASWDFVVTNATTSAFTWSSSTVYTILVTPTAQGTVTVNMPAAAGSDAATNASTVATQLSRIYDSIAPTVVLSAPSSATNAPFTATATFSEPVTWITSWDFVVANATTSAFTWSSSTVYTILVTPTAQGAVTVNMPAAAWSDAATNTSTVATQLSVNYDTVVPSVVLSTSATNPTSSSFTVTATFSEAMTGVTVSDFTVVNGTKSSFNAVSSTVYTVIIVPTTDGTVSTDIALATSTDLAGNNNTASNQISLTYNRPSGGGGGGGGSSSSSTVVATPVVTNVTPTATGATETGTGEVETQTGTTTPEETDATQNTFAEVLEKALRDREEASQGQDSNTTTQETSSTTDTQPTGNLGNKYVDSLIQRGIVSTTTETFRPDDNITRAELLKIAMRANGVDYSDSTPNTSNFTDLDTNAWSSKVAAKAIELWITNGYNDGTFKPDTPITRIEALKFALKLSDFTIPAPTSPLFIDVQDEWMIKYVNAAKLAGIISWQDNGSGPEFRPLDTLTRLEAAKIIIKTVDSKTN